MPRLAPDTTPVTLTLDAPTRVRGRSLSLGDEKWARFQGGPIGRHRRQIIITNGDPTLSLYIVAGHDDNVDPDATSEKYMQIFPRTSITIFTNDTIILKSLDGRVDNISVLETFYI
jgi:hypothetical protein